MKHSSQLSIISHSAEETVQLGKCIGQYLKPGQIVALIGDLGAGKTWLSRGIGNGLKISEKHHVHSPAFDLIHEHPGPISMYHMDFYRLDTFSAEDEMWILEYIHAQDGVCVIEWANKFIIDILDHYLQIQLTMIEECTTWRKLEFYAIGDEYLSIIDQIETQYNQIKESINL